MSIYETRSFLRTPLRAHISNYLHAISNSRMFGNNTGGIHPSGYDLGPQQPQVCPSMPGPGGDPYNQPQPPQVPIMPPPCPPQGGGGPTDHHGGAPSCGPTEYQDDGSHGRRERDHSPDCHRKKSPDRHHRKRHDSDHEHSHGSHSDSHDSDDHGHKHGRGHHKHKHGHGHGHHKHGRGRGHGRKHGRGRGGHSGSSGSCSD
ncbi:hypothetical protein JZ751_029494 [Albula glossodonta]|uniref:Uncharacterized protein n=1 Tax=Albula glossodonta TaxID=121402 RepID=A0A8T2PB25_9TELE|nr:hypothetical protein JZ751_029494 [Albula glossodonta]